jgi:uncharacterized protein (DUF2249 family)
MNPSPESPTGAASLDEAQIDELRIDARALEPPQPFELAIAAMERLQPGQRIRLLLHREPIPLYSLLDTAGGWQHETQFSPEGGYFTIFIQRTA